MKHQSISRWLSQLGLPQYCSSLEQEYDGVEDLLHLSEFDLLDLGVHNHLHRLHLLTSLRLLQERERRRELRMMAEGRFASLPRSLHAHHNLPGGPAHPGGPSSPLAGPSSSSRRLQASLATSMDLLSSRPGFPPGSVGTLSEMPAAASYQPVSIHGTLPRRKRGAPNAATHGNYSWEHKVGFTQSSRGGNAFLVPTHLHPPISPSTGQNAIDDLRGYREPSASLDATVDYVKFSRDQFILDCPSEKLRRELEEELKMNCEEPRSHAWYHGAIPRQVSENLVQRDGDFLIRDSLSSPGCYVLTCQWRNAAQHFKINKKVVMLNEAYSRVEYRLEREGFDSVPALIRYYVGNRKSVSQVVGAIIFQPINRALPLRCLEEKYELSVHHRDATLLAQERRSQKRLSLNITNGHTHDNTHAAHEGSHCQDNGAVRGGQLRLKDRCGSQPASLNQVQERRRPLKAHQSESFLPLGSRPPPLQSPDHLLQSPKSPVFRTGSEPVLSPSMSRRSADPLAGQPIRGSDSQLCPKPPPKPSKVALARPARPPCSQPLLPPPSSSSSSSDSSSSAPGLAAPPLDSSCLDAPGSSWRSSAFAAPPLPPAKPLKLHPHHHLHPHLAPSSSSPSLSPSEAPPHSLTGRGERDRPDSPNRDPTTLPPPPPPPPPPPGPCSYVERLRREAEGRRRKSRGEDEEEAGGQRGLDRSSYHHAIAALENTSEEEEEEDAGREEEEEQEEEKRRIIKERNIFRRPVVETESTFRPSEFKSRLLPPENKPLETEVLKKAKELLLRHEYQSIARHLLMADCQVARILGVTPEVKGQMGVASGLELVTLPHGRQLRLDLMERHHTMAIGVAVDILGCTGSVDERASTLNRIILVAMELKDAVGDLFAFTALMKALDMQQISRLEETWTTLRRNFTQTAISYEKVLKPFYKNLYEGSASSPPGVCVPLLLPLLTLMERPSLTPPEGAELWETSDQGCDIMLRHLEAARGVARNAHSYTANAHKILQGFQCDEDLLEVFQTDFHLRLLWGSRGASVNQSDRYNKFNLILTALSRKLEPPPKTQTLI